MNQEMTVFFPPGTTVLALPGWEKPRILFPDGGVRRRWQVSSLYPASRWQGRAYRFFLRCKGVLGLVEKQVSHRSNWEVGEFVRDVLPKATSAVVFVGPPGPAQKITIQLQDATDRVLGYVKYAEKPAAVRRVSREYYVLKTLPDNLGPVPLKYGRLLNGEALLLSPFLGQSVPAKLPPPEELVALLTTMPTGLEYLVEKHPWINSILEDKDKHLVSWIENLGKRKWPAVLQHGDLTPWNVKKSPDGNVRLLDWEYAYLEGFPHLDLIYYILRVAALIYRWGPLRAFRYAKMYLSKKLSLLSDREVDALVRLTAYVAHLQALEDGHPADAPLLRWYRQVWEAKE